MACPWCRNYIVFEDILSFLPADKALAALKVLDGDGDGKVSPCDMRDAVLKIYKERKNLAATLSVGSLPVQHLMNFPSFKMGKMTSCTAYIAEAIFACSQWL